MRDVTLQRSGRLSAFGGQHAAADRAVKRPRCGLFGGVNTGSFMEGVTLAARIAVTSPGRESIDQPATHTLPIPHHVREREIESVFMYGGKAVLLEGILRSSAMCDMVQGVADNLPLAVKTLCVTPALEDETRPRNKRISCDHHGQPYL